MAVKRGKIQDMKKIPYYHFRAEVYNVDFYIFVKTPDKQVVKWICDNFDLNITGSGTSRGWTVFYQEKKKMFIWIEDDKFNIENIGILAHELIHAKNEIFDYIGYVRKNGDNDEPEAYFYDWLLRMGCKAFNGHK